jgi:hypothetical protein
MKCPICNNTDNNRQIAAREMFFGMRDEFNYTECHACGSIFLAPPPEDMARYYPDNYYSLRGESPLKRFIKSVRARHEFRKPTLAGYLITRIFGPSHLEWLKHVNPRYDAPILDIGCGTGELLRQLAAIGYTDLTGIDPYGTESQNPRILRTTVDAAPRRAYHLILMNHSLEHCANPLEMLRATRTQIDQNGSVLIRMPVAGNMAWRMYREHWVQLDAPRHLVLLTESTFRQIAPTCGFAVEKVIYDSGPSQFLASEQYKNGVPLLEQKRKQDRATMQQYAELAREANASNDGDQAVFILRPI